MAELRVLYVNGTMSLRELATTHGASVSTMMKVSAREGWEEARKRVAAQVAVAAQQQINSGRVDELRAFCEADLQVAKALRGSVARLLASAGKDGKPALSTTELRQLAGTAADAQRIGRMALGLSSDNTGHAGPNGVGPVLTSNVTPEEYKAALKQALSEF